VFDGRGDAEEEAVECGGVIHLLISHSTVYDDPE
jgi:hypothetical protein